MTFPDAPGCFSAADSLDDLFSRVEEALELWIAERLARSAPAAPIRDLSDIRRDPAWAESFADVVLVIAIRPPQVDLQAAA